MCQKKLAALPKHKTQGFPCFGPHLHPGVVRGRGQRNSAQGPRRLAHCSLLLPRPAKLAERVKRSQRPRLLPGLWRLQAGYQEGHSTC